MLPGLSASEVNCVCGRLVNIRLEMHGRSCDFCTFDNEALALVSKVALGSLYFDCHIVFARVGNEINHCVIESNSLGRGNLDCRYGRSVFQREVSVVDLLGQIELECSCDVFLLTCCLDGHGEYIGIGIFLRRISELEAAESEHVCELEALLCGDVVLFVSGHRVAGLGEVEFGRLCEHEVAALVPGGLLALLC